MPDTDFSRTVCAAQAGDEAAFVRLWRDANPLLVRYLRVVGYDDPYDAACEAWITVLRGLPEFAGDEVDWFVWLLSCARVRAHEGSLRRAWGSVDVTPGVGLPVGAPQRHDVEDDLAGAAVEDPRTRGIADSLAALRSLPLGQGEVLVLRFGAGLSVRDTARVAGVDEVAVHRLAQRGLERLAVDQDLLRWSLAAPRSVAELADERVVVGAFASHVGGGRGTSGRRTTSRSGDLGRSGSRSARRRRGTGLPGAGGSGATRPGARVIATVSMPGAQVAATPSLPGSTARRGASAAARRSRGAALAIGVVSASVMSLGGLSAAAYVGVLPGPVQQAMHDAIGAPAPHPSAGEPGSSGSGASSTATAPGGRNAGGASTGGPSAAAVTGLCRAWSADQAAGTPRDRSTAFRDLARRAGGAEQVPAYCAAAAAHPGSPTVPGRAPDQRPTTPGKAPAGTPNPQSTEPGKGTTKTPKPQSTNRPTANPGKGTTRTTSSKPTDSGKGATTSSKPQPTGGGGTGAATPPQPTAPTGRGGGSGTGTGSGSGSGSGGGSGARSAGAGGAAPVAPATRP